MFHYLLPCVLILALPVVLQAGGDEFQKAEFSAGADKLLYRVLEPAKIEPNQKYPLVLFLHGAGERGSDNKAQLVHGSTQFTKPETRAKFPAYVLFPQCPAGKKWVEVPWSDKTPHRQPSEPSISMKLTRQLLDEYLKTRPVDPRRIYVMGLSMGGFGTWDFAARYPELVAAIVPICGGADDSTAAKLKDMPVWAFHGDLDTAVFPERSRSMVAALKKAGNERVRYTEYPKVGHNSWSPAFAEPELLPWLFAQKHP
jgi:predicted peptidase